MSTLVPTHPIAVAFNRETETSGRACSRVRCVGALVTFLLPVSAALAQPYAPNQYTLRSEVQTAIQILRQGQYSWPTNASGRFEGQLVIPVLVSDTADQFRGLNFTHTVCIPNLVGGCLYSHDYGLKLDMNFGASGPLTLSYKLPYTVTFRFPVSVYPGQRIVLQPQIQWQEGAAVVGQQALEYHQTTTVVTDAPADAMDDLTVAFSQYADRALLHLGLPVVPGLNSAPLDLPLGIPPFNQGGGSFGGSTTRLGGAGRLDNSGSIVFGESNTEISVGASSSNVRMPAWQQNSEVFGVTATILGYVPTPQTQAASLALTAVRAAGDFRLDVTLDGGVRRQDIVNIAVENQPLVVEVPGSLVPGDTWRFNSLPLELKYGVRSLTQTYYPLSLKVVFDMRGVDSATVAKYDLGDFWAGTVEVPWQPRSTAVSVSGALPVVAKEKTPQALQLDPRMPISAILAQPNELRRPTAPASLLVTPATVSAKTVRTLTRVSPNSPDRAVATPGAKEFAVVLGKASPARAGQVVAWMRAHGVPAYAAKLNTSEQLISFGVFRKQEDAQRLAATLGTIFDLPITVHPGDRPLAPKFVDDRIEKRMLQP